MFALFLTAFFINYFIQLILVLYLLIFSIFSFNIYIYCNFPAISLLCPFKYVVSEGLEICLCGWILSIAVWAMLFLN